MANRKTAASAHIPELDGLRGVAVLLVLLFHFSIVFSEVGGPLTVLRTLFTPGWTGVDLFFILSGFLITGILLDEKGTAGFFKRFYIRRALRIFPVYYLALLICFTVGRASLMPREGISALAVLAYLFNFSNWLSLNQTEIPAMIHYWSLAVEEQFYLCWPLAVFLLSRKALLRLLGCVIVLAPVVRFFILSAAGDPETCKRIAAVITPARVDGLAFGALVAIIVREPRIYGVMLRHANKAIAAAAGLLLVWFGFKGKFHLESAATLALLYSVLSITYALIVLRTVGGTGTGDPLQRLLRWPVLRLAGKYSYATYVFHLPLMAATDAIFDSLAPEEKQLWAVPWFCGRIAVTFLVARLSWSLVESPMLSLKHILAPSPKPLETGVPVSDSELRGAARLG